MRGKPDHRIFLINGIGISIFHNPSSQDNKGSHKIAYAQMASFEHLQLWGYYNLNHADSHCEFLLIFIRTMDIYTKKLSK